MDKTNISENKPRHTKAILGVGIIVLFIIFFTVYYQILSPKNQQKEIQQSENSTNFTTFLAKQINEQQKNGETIPSEIRSFLGKWQGEWALAGGGKIPSAIVVSEVALEKGVTVSYASKENVSLDAIEVDGTAIGTVVLLQKEGNPLALEFIFPQFENADAVQFHFWFADPSSQNLVGEFIHPETGETVQGTFNAVK